MNKKRVLVTGMAGRIGSIVRDYLGNDYELRVGDVRSKREGDEVRKSGVDLLSLLWHVRCQSFLSSFPLSTRFRR